MKVPNRDIITHFSKNPVDLDARRSVFRIDPTTVTSFKVGDLIPLYVDTDIMPGDTVKASTSHLLRMATPFVPVLDNSYFDYFWFFVPHRLVWNDWEKFITGGDDPDSFGTSFVPPVYPHKTVTASQSNLYGYMGLPYGVAVEVDVKAFRAYRKAWNDWFRNEALQSYSVFSKSSGVDSTDYSAILKVNKYKDYFTSALPAPQKGAAVNIFQSLTAPVLTSVTNIGVGKTTGQPIRFYGSNNAADKDTQVMGYTAYADGVAMNKSYDMTSTADSEGVVNSPANLYVDMSSLTVNALRLAFQSQKLLEKDSRSGSRYVETIFSHFGVTSPDARLQRAEYLGGGHIPVQMNQVLQQSSSASEPTPIGHVAAMSKTVSGKYDFEKSFTEHGTLMCLACVRTAQTYQQGVNRMWQRKTRFDYYWPVFANIGEQPVFKKELYAGAGDTAIFGYQEAWAEYRFKPSIATGLMNSAATGSLDVWHYGNNFAAAPALGSSFVEQDRAGVARTLAVTNQDDFLCDSLFVLDYARVMPTFSMPGLIDHF